MSAQGQSTSCSLIVGHSASMRFVREWVAKWGPRNCTVGVIGPTGVGKNLIARELHRIHGRGKCVRVSLSDTPPASLHSELFGHVKGAFTDAREDRTGAVREAEGGTLFIDELQDAGLEAQRMLRDIADREPVSRLGEHRPYVPDCRLVVGSQVPVLELVRRHGFKADLAYRLLVEEIELPPLADHLDDLADLVPAVLAEVAMLEGIEALAVDEEAMALLAGHRWPGNVRELQRALRRALIEAQGEGIIGVRHFPGWLLAGPGGATEERHTHMPSQGELAEMHARLGTIVAVAEYYGKCPRTISRWMQKLAIADAA